jgi:hypothetical protein
LGFLIVRLLGRQIGRPQFERGIVNARVHSVGLLGDDQDVERSAKAQGRREDRPALINSLRGAALAHLLTGHLDKAECWL